MTAAAYAIDHFTEPERRVFRPRERITPSAWAEKYRVVVRGPAQGKWTNALTPYCIEPMDTIALPWVRKVFLCWAPQTGKTSVGINFMLYAIDVDPGPMFYVMPDEKVSKRIAKRQLIPTIRSTPRISELLSRRIDDVSSLHVNFVNGCDLMMAWASSAAALASESIRYIFWDEPGKYPDFVGEEADPFSLGDVRTNAYPYTSKQIFYSTPKSDGDAFDRLIRSEAEEIRRYHAKCPICGQLQLMDFTRIHWQGKKDHREVLRGKLARYTCEHCGMDWDDHARNLAVRAGRWKAEHPVERPTAIAFGPLESWYSPFVSLSKAAADFLKGQEDPKKLQAFVTQHQARPWADRIENKSESSVLDHRTATPPGIVPEWALALTAGFDTQKRGFWFVVRAWAEDMTSQAILYGHLATFDDVEAMVYQTEFKFENSQRTMGIWRAAIDTGGSEGEHSTELSRTEEVYEFLARMRMKYGQRDVGGRGIYGVKGSSRRQFQRVTEEKDIDRKPEGLGRNVKYRAMVGLRMLDTFEMKCLIHWRLSERKGQRRGDNGEELPPDSNRFLLHSETGMDYVRQLLAEELVKDRRGRREWRRIRGDNHYLDCEVYAAACVESSWQPCFKLLVPATKEALKLEGEKSKKSAVDNSALQKPSTAPIAPAWNNRGNASGSSWIGRR